MRKIALAAAIFGALACTTGAQAKGCIKGAVVGGTAGHFAGHHGLLGAAAGCLIGRHEAKKRVREQQMRDERARRDTFGSGPND